jgi:hypothetical protein
MRDDFNKETKDLLARRVGYRCSNPNCRALTSEPHEDPAKSTNIGVAAHITGASEGGPRYNAKLSADERKSPENGIWLCQNDAKKVDDDEQTYPVDLLRRWKELSEQAASLEIGQPLQSTIAQKSGDVELIRFYSQCFDRSAFQDSFREEVSMEAFDRAIEDTITAINTGCLRARDGAILSQSKGKAFLENYKWRQGMDSIVDLLRALRSRYNRAVEQGEIHLGKISNGKQFYHIRSKTLVEWMDDTRTEIFDIFSEICEEAQIPVQPFIRKMPRRW